jgi:gluconokinase
MQIPPTVVVMGVAGSGKTTVGSALAARLGVPFADADSFHSPAARAQMAAGHPLDDLDRAPWLETLAGWLRSQPRGAVLACSALKRRYRDVLRTGSADLCFLHLIGDPGVVTERVGDRPDHYMPVTLVQSQYEALEPLAADERGVEIDLTLAPEQIIDTFLKRFSMLT